MPLFPFLSPPPAPPQVLEYVGKGKSIVDVGLAQARRALSPRSHYFELEILDPGEKCYIALGVARRVRGGLGIGVRGGPAGWRHPRSRGRAGKWGMWVKNGGSGLTEGVKGGWSLPQGWKWPRKVGRGLKFGVRGG